MDIKELNELSYYDLMEYIETDEIKPKFKDYSIKGDIIEVKSDDMWRKFIEPKSGKEVYMFGQQYDLIKRDLPKLRFNFKEINGWLIPYESWKIVSEIMEIKNKPYNTSYFKAVLNE